MGFLDHSTNNIILDAVLTDAGRRALARNDGSFSIFKFAFSDEEVDYGHIVNFGRTVGKEKIEKNTPILEASTQGNLAQKYRLRSVNNDSLTRLPIISLETDLTSNILSLSRSGTNTTSPTNKLIRLSQVIQGAGTMDPDLTDFSFRIVMDNLFLTIAGRVPDSVDENNIATYTIEADPTITSQNTSSLSMTIVCRSASDDLFTSYKQVGTDIVEKICSISGINSGAFMSFRIQIV
ncbi:hypothetical protein CL622_06275 [archaeon]|nr:hypothetical protein [archaeon]|tara:strand:- start:234 stop:941 length:708 start_codon:yes stop_codon:yes gene_type:complete